MFCAETVYAWAGANGIHITGGQMASLQAFAGHVLEVNRRMNLTRITEPVDFAVKHVIDSLTLLPHIGDGVRVADIGSGAGLPGIVLAIMRPQTQFDLLDSLAKRVRFLGEAAANLGLTNVSPVHTRAQEHVKGAYDIATARAVARLDKLLPMAMPLLRPGGTFIAMKSADIAAELADISYNKLYNVEIAPEITRTLVLIRKEG
jgi:16S rRNA (guanine527-N7)-methyltransferase